VRGEPVGSPLFHALAASRFPAAIPSGSPGAFAVDAGLSPTLCCHTFRATGITAYLQNGRSLEHAQKIAAYESARTTKLYDRRGDQVSLDEIERIII